MIPPSSNMIAALNAFMALYPNSDLTQGQFLIVLWGSAICFILQRVFMIWGFCKYYKVKPMAEEDIPSLKETLKEGWQGFITGISFNKFGMVVFICIATCILGMVIPGSSLVVIFGPVFITALASVGVNPILAAAMLPCICGVMCGITLPLGRKRKIASTLTF